MKLKTKKELWNGKKIIKAKIHGRYRTFSEICKLPGLEELNLTSDVLNHRYNAGDSEERFLRKVRAKKRNSDKPKLPEHIQGLTNDQIDTLGEERPRLIYDCGYHKDKLDDEILIGFFSMQWISKEVPWRTKRISTTPKSKHSKIQKYPLFIKKMEAIEKGFIVV